MEIKMISVNRYKQPVKQILIVTSLFIIAACGSSDDDDESVGSVKLYNTSSNAPDVFLTLDEDLDNDYDGEIERTYSGVGFGEAGSRFEVPSTTYNIELAWQDEDSSLRKDLSIIYESSVFIPEDTTALYVLTESFPNPIITEYFVPEIDLEDDTTNDLFNLRFLNVHPDFDRFDVYISASDETFNEAVFMGSHPYLALSENSKFEEGEYIFYVTDSDTNELLFTSETVSYAFNSQYIVAFRENFGAGEFAFVLDNIGPTTFSEYQASNAQAEFRIYNGILTSDLLEDYEGDIAISVSNLFGESASEQQVTETLGLGSFTPVFTVENGDYVFDTSVSDSTSFLLQKQLISLPANVQRTLFYYTRESAVDADGDGDIDENGDGIIDETEAVVQTLVVNNSNRERLYEHEIEIINLVESDDFAGVTFYFVKSDETIETAEIKQTVGLATPRSLLLRNNTYEVYATAEVDGIDILLNSQLLTLDESSPEQFLLFEKQSDGASNYSMKFIQQIPDES
jgi:hypothetical protein